MIYQPIFPNNERLDYNVRTSEEIWYVVFFSDDLGATWQLLGGTPSPKWSAEMREVALKCDPSCLIRIDAIPGAAHSGLVQCGNMWTSKSDLDAHWLRVDELTKRAAKK